MTCPAPVPRPSGSRRRAALPVPEVFSGSAVETPVRVASPARPAGREPPLTPGLGTPPRAAMTAAAGLGDRTVRPRDVASLVAAR